MDKVTNTIRYIIVNPETKQALYGKEKKTLLFSSDSGAEELATQLLDSYMIVEIDLPEEEGDLPF